MNDVIRCRIKLAQDKLLYTADTISSVGEQCGYKNTEHFCRQFRKFTGLSPRQYRIKAMQKQTREINTNEETGI
jgi:AraC-like DNA-binding protein